MAGVGVDRRLRRRDVSSVSTQSQVSEQLGLVSSSAAASQEEIAASARSVGGNPIRSKWSLRSNTTVSAGRVGDKPFSRNFASMKPSMPPRASSGITGRLCQ